MNHLDVSTAESISQESCEPELISHRGFMRHWKRHTLNDQALKKDFYLQKHWCLWSIGRKGTHKIPTGDIQARMYGLTALLQYRHVRHLRCNFTFMGYRDKMYVSRGSVAQLGKAAV